MYFSLRLSRSHLGEYRSKWRSSVFLRENAFWPRPLSTSGRPKLCKYYNVFYCFLKTYQNIIRICIKTWKWLKFFLEAAVGPLRGPLTAKMDLLGREGVNTEHFFIRTQLMDKTFYDHEGVDRRSSLVARRHSFIMPLQSVGAILPCRWLSHSAGGYMKQLLFYSGRGYLTQQGYLNQEVVILCSWPVISFNLWLVSN